MRRLTIVTLLAIFLCLAGQDFAVSAPKNESADEAKAGEDTLDGLLRKLGSKDAGLAAKIERAIDKGVIWLMKQQQEDGHFLCYDGSADPSFLYPFGGTALCLLAIKKSMSGLYGGDCEDVREMEKELKSISRKADRLESKKKMGKTTSKQDEELQEMQGQVKQLEKRIKMQKCVDKGMEWLRTNYKKAKGGGRLMTYDVGVLLMLLEGYYTKKAKKRDGYVIGVDKRAIAPADLAWIKELVKWLENGQKENAGKVNPFSGEKDGSWRYPGAAQDGSIVDNSNTQYAVLGLKAASRMGVHISSSDVWVKVCEFYLRTQESNGPEIQRKPPAQDPKTGGYYFPPVYTNPQGKDKARGFGYLPKFDNSHPATGAMTTAALAALVTAKSELYELKYFPRNKDFEAKVDKMISDGVAWLGHYFSVETNPTAKTNMRYGWHYYYLYGLERAGVLCQTEFFGKHPWYLEGAKYLVGQQKDDGSWADGLAMPGGAVTNQLCSTAFALLFLKRATTPVKVPLTVPRPEITKR